MRTAVSTLRLLDPQSLAEALRMLRDEPDAVPLAGATDLYVALNAGVLSSGTFVNLWRLAPLRRIATEGDLLSIGALATYTALIRSRLVRRRVPMLVSAAQAVGGVQIQNRGTLGGNVANGSPAGDTLPVLAAADAMVVLRSAGEERRVPLTSYYTGYRENARRSDELITAVEIPPIEGVQWFRKVGTRAAQSISKVVMAAVRGPSPRVALGSVAPTVIRLYRTEAVLAALGSFEEVKRTLNSEIDPIDDLRSTASYRRTVATNLVHSFWNDTKN